MKYTQGDCSQWTHDAKITSSLRHNDVATSFWRNNDIIIASCVRWFAWFYPQGLFQCQTKHLMTSFRNVSNPRDWLLKLYCISLAVQIGRITVSSHERHSVSDHQQFHCLCMKCIELTRKKRPKFHITEAFWHSVTGIHRCIHAMD